MALATTVFLMVILTVVFNTVVRQHLQWQADDELRSRAAAVATTVDISRNGIRVRETANDELLDTNVWIYADARLLERPASAAPTSPVTRAADQLAARGRQHCTTLEHAGGPVRLCAQTIGVAAAVVTALDLSPYRSSADTLLLASLALGAAVLTCTYVLTRLTVGRALRPVRTMTDQATQWSAIASTERFGGTRRPVELARLGASLDALLDRIRAVLRHEQQLTGELSHELRTPLSRIIAELDWWQARPRSTADIRTAHAASADAAQAMHTIRDTLLDDARVGASTAPGTADVLPVLRRLAEHLDVPGHVQVVVDVADPRLNAGVLPYSSNASSAAPSSTTPCGTRVHTSPWWPSGSRTAYASTSPTTAPAYRRRSPGSSSSRAGVPIPPTDTAEWAWDCRSHDAWPAPPAGR